MAANLLEVRNLMKHFAVKRRLLRRHPLGYVKMEYLCHRVGVMYLGKLVEVGGAGALCSRPRHPYTATLIAAATPPGRRPPWPTPITGEVPNPLDIPSGCAFHPRCPSVMPECRRTIPPLREIEPQRWVACHLYPDKLHTLSFPNGGGPV
jgi:oligopeptide/dipeptide ABC transporter ATP-binding protein